MALEVANKVIKYLSRDLSWHALEDVKRELSIRGEEVRVLEEAIEFLAEFGLIEYDRGAARVRISRSIHNLLRRRGRRRPALLH
jgi:hypothetical protein